MVLHHTRHKNRTLGSNATSTIFIYLGRPGQPSTNALIEGDIEDMTTQTQTTRVAVALDLAGHNESGNPNQQQDLEDHQEEAPQWEAQEPY